MDNSRKRFAVAAILLAAALLFFFPLSGVLRSPKIYTKQFEYLNGKQVTATELSASAATVSILISLIPDDVATPIADQVAGLAKDFLIVLSALTAEKYLLTVTAFVAFQILIPLALFLLAINVFAGSALLGKLCGKIILFSLAIYAVVPFSVQLSRVIDDTYKESIQATIDSANHLKTELAAELNVDIEEITEAEDGETDVAVESSASDEGNLWDGVKEGVGNITGKVTEGAAQLAENAKGVVEGVKSAVKTIPELPSKAAGYLNRVMEALVVMIVTTCVIPILTMMVLLWVVKNIFSAPFELHNFRRHQKEPDDLAETIAEQEALN